MNSTETDWRDAIIDAATDTLVEEGVCIVRQAADGKGPAVVSRMYRARDYASSRVMHRVGWAQATRALNQDCANYYVVQRHADGWIAWTGMHSVLIHRGEF